MLAYVYVSGGKEVSFLESFVFVVNEWIPNEKNPVRISLKGTQLAENCSRGTIT